MCFVYTPITMSQVKSRVVVGKRTMLKVAGQRPNSAIELFENRWDGSAITLICWIAVETGGGLAGMYVYWDWVPCNCLQSSVSSSSSPVISVLLHEWTRLGRSIVVGPSSPKKKQTSRNTSDDQNGNEATARQHIRFSAQWLPNIG